MSRSLVITAIALIAAFALVLAFAGPTCAFGFVGCGEGTNECGYDCPGSAGGGEGMNCMKSGDPFEMCVCNVMVCHTAACDVTEA